MYTKEYIEHITQIKKKIDSAIATVENMAMRSDSSVKQVKLFCDIDKLVRRRSYVNLTLYDYFLYQETEDYVLDKFKSIMFKHNVAIGEGRPSKYKNIMLQKYNEIYSAWTETDKIKKNFPSWWIRFCDKIWFNFNGMWGVRFDRQ